MIRKVNLEIKTALLFALGLVGVVLSSLLLTRYFFLYSLYELENMEVRRASTQASSVIESIIKSQEEASYDWAHWDETYLFLIDKDTVYVERNLTQESLDILGVDIMVFLKPMGTLSLAYGRFSDSEVSHITDQMLNSDSVTEYLHLMERRRDSDKQSFSGLIRVDQQLWVISLTSVRDNSGQSDMVGWMLWAQDLTARFPERYQAILMADNQLITDSEALTWWTEVSVSEPSLVIERTEQFLTHYSLLKSAVNEPIGVLKTIEPRMYFQQAKIVFFRLIVVMTVVTSAIALGMYGIFWITVSKRFSYFEKGMQSLLSSVDAPIKNKHTDEFDRITQWVSALAESSTQTQEKLQETLQKFDALYHGHTVGMILLTDKIIVDVSPTLLMLLGFQREQLIGQPIGSICGCHNTQCGSDQFYRLLSQGQHHFETAMKRSNGTEIICSVEAALLNDRDQTSIMLSVKDISEQKQQAALIQTLTHYDPVSGLLNRPTLVDNANQLLLNHPPFSILYLYAARLKEIEAVYGHDYYDRAVQHLATTLKHTFPDLSIGRVSEHAFMVLSTDSQDELIQKGNRILTIYRQKIVLEDIECDLGLKATLVSSSIGMKDFERLSRGADYAATHHRSSVFVTMVSAEDTQRAETLLVIHRDIISALKEGQFMAYYQPIVKASSGELVGFEALARWQHPQLGLLFPEVFIPVAEQRKLIVELGEQILDKACQFIQSLPHHESHHLSIHVNISSPHFHHNSLVDTLKRLIHHYQLHPRQLVLELTESILLGAEEDIIQRMQTIKALGVQLALDDFGTGYSSFSSLCNFPLDIVKLDKSYIDRLEDNQKAQILIKNIIYMAQELGMTTVAEGVESVDQLRQLLVWDIDEIQGYYFYKPMTSEQAKEHFLTLLQP
ncbi:EAL domain-containing protein [Vibrio sp. V31_P5A7T61]|uniref:EAL domain-containing protein n=1 Tax=unclassified Vibrio TaxID=2614977 RepID=UPI00137317BC|nr:MULTISPECIES: EAL domain-containing protein [unclassified Vibrio]NAW61118.1 EAL domain-containing protein [Vibrio sp. V31_P5A7T61]NAX00596.1 EAL domain-containing protein [Vibrio sp. V34_P3A8T189]NAX09550.1 EAL domain-containing protein [Vibrio sp. V40_P2S30T141]NAX63859.1 EAL domain-containing protein [Vibrio sp. V32_P6A28T40]